MPSCSVFCTHMTEKKFAWILLTVVLEFWLELKIAMLSHSGIRLILHGS